MESMQACGNDRAGMYPRDAELMGREYDFLSMDFSLKLNGAHHHFSWLIFVRDRSDIQKIAAHAAPAHFAVTANYRYRLARGL
jgi:hypothetical protein